MRDFVEVFRTRLREEVPFVLVAGQAVNLWAEFYLDQEPALEALAPFVSEDVDLLVEPAFLDALAVALHGNLTKSEAAQDGQIAILVSEHFGGIRVDVMGPIFGLTWREQRRTKDRVAQVAGVPVMDPITLLRCKLKNLARLPQSGRQDEKHVKILLPVVRCYLRQALEKIERGEIDPRNFTKEVKFLLSLEKDAGCRQGLEMAEASIIDALPRQEIEKLGKRASSEIFPRDPQSISYIATDPLHE